MVGYQGIGSPSSTNSDESRSSLDSEIPEFYVEAHQQASKIRKRRAAEMSKRVAHTRNEELCTHGAEKMPLK